MIRAARAISAVALAFGVLLAGPVAASASPDERVPAPAAPSAIAGVDDFVFESFTADYFLDVDENGRSTLRTVETFVAVFP